MLKIEINTERIKKLLEIKDTKFPKYSTQILNIANQNAQGTRPKIVGKMSELIKEFTGNTLEEWEKWYLERKPDAINRATDKIFSMVNTLKDVINNDISKDLIKAWVRDLVIVKTFIGLKFQEAIFKELSQKFNIKYKLPSPEEESKGIDGFLIKNDKKIPVSLKADTYEKIKPMLLENLPEYIIYYEKTKQTLKIYIPDNLENILKK